MKLTITELPGASAGYLHLSVRFTVGEIQRHYEIKDYQPCLSSNLYQDLTEYYADYDFTNPRDDHKLQSRLIAAGRHMGDQLAGEDHQLHQLAHLLAEQGCEQLEVRVEGNSEMFFREPWELLILNDSEQLLSCEARSFVRQVLAGENTGEAEPDSVAVPAASSITFMFSQREGDSSAALAYMASGMDAGYSTTLCQAESLAQLREELTRQAPQAALHYEGPLLQTDKGPALCLSGGEAVEIEALAQVLVEAGIHLLTLSPLGPPLASEVNPASVVAAARQGGLHNIVLSAFPGHPAIVHPVFTHLYQQLTEGVSLDAAIPVIRRSLFEQGSGTRFGFDGQAPQLWPLLLHYSHQSLNFYQEENAESQTQATGQDNYRLLHRLHGFRSRMLPPLLRPLVDPPEFVQNAQTALTTPLRVYGRAGLGKSQYLHWLAFYLTTGDAVKQAFYFDLAQPFQAEDVVSLLTGVTGVSETDDLSAVLDKLAEQRCLFVFDHVDTTSTVWLQGLRDTFHERGHITAIAAYDSHLEADDKSLSIELEPLTPAQESVLVAALSANFPALRDVPSDQLEELLSACQGIPWLIERMLPHLHTAPADVIKTVIKIAQRLSASDSLATDYFQWRWSSLSKHSRRLLGLAAPVQGLLVDMLQILDQEPSLVKLRNQLFADLEGDDIGIRPLLDELRGSGLLIQYPHGSLVDEAFIELIEADDDSDSLPRLPFARAIAATVTVLSRHLQNQPNPSVLNNLLLNRRSWAQQLELIWQAGGYHQVLLAKSSLGRLLEVYQLDGEFQQWLTELLGRTPAPSVGDAVEGKYRDTPEDISSWFRIAAECVGQSALLARQLNGSAESWRLWLLDSDGCTLQGSPTLANAAAGFLQCLTSVNEQWQEALTIVERMIPLLEEQQAMGQLMENYRLAIRCCHALDRFAEAEAYQERLLEDMDYADAPAGTALRQYLFAIAQNLKVGQTKQARTLLKTVSLRPDAEQAKGLIADLQQQLDEMNPAAVKS